MGQRDETGLIQRVISRYSLVTMPHSGQCYRIYSPCPLVYLCADHVILGYSLGGSVVTGPPFCGAPGVGWFASGGGLGGGGRVGLGLRCNKKDDHWGSSWPRFYLNLTLGGGVLTGGVGAVQGLVLTATYLSFSVGAGAEKKKMVRCELRFEMWTGKVWKDMNQLWAESITMRTGLRQALMHFYKTSPTIFNRDLFE